MKSLKHFVVMGLVVSTWGFAQVPSTEKPQIDALVERLGAEEFADREQATKDLAALGEQARAALEAARGSENLERKIRAQRLLDVLDGAGGESPGRLRPVEPDGRPGVPEVRGQSLREAPRPEQFGGDPEAFVKALREYMVDLTRDQARAFDGFRVLEPGGIIDLGLDTLVELGPVGAWDMGPGGAAQVSIVENGKRVSAKRSADGAIELTIQEPGQPDRTFKAESEGAFRVANPDVYEQYKDCGIFGRSSGMTVLPRTFRSRFPVMPPVLRPGLGLGGSAAGPLELRQDLRAPVLGVSLTEVPEALRAHVDVPVDAVLVEAVQPGSRAESAGMERYDIITHVNGGEVGTAEAVRARLDARTNSSVTLSIVRGGRPMTLIAECPR